MLVQKNDPKASPDVPDIFGPPITHYKDDCLEVRLPKYFRDQGWANGIGQVQDEICRYATQNLTMQRKVVFDFRSCRWIDPFPLMSILLETANSRHLGMSIDIRLPEADTGMRSLAKGPYQESPNRLLLFLKQEGFLDCIDKQNDECIRYFPKHEDGYRNLHVKPSYEDALCIPMRLFIVPNNDEENKVFANRTVENLLKGIDTNLDSKVAPHTRERLIYKLRVALQEVLHNAQEHAYEMNTTPRLLAIYVRYRTGGLGLDSAGRQVYQECVKGEKEHCPMLAEDWLTARPGCLEMFVMDRGIGMVRSFENAGVPLAWKYKFEEVMKKTFADGQSTKPEHQTRYGGLHLLHNLLVETGDFLRALEGGIWFGCGVPISRETAKTHLLTEDHAHMQGLSMHLRLGWKAEADYGGKWAKFEQGMNSEVWNELSFNENDFELYFKWFESQKVFDERFGELKEYGNNNDWILWLVPPHRMKWDIINFIEYKIAPLISGQAVLIIADIPSYEAETYAVALDEFKALGSSDWPSKFSKIILSTNRWRFAAVSHKKHGQRHGFSKLYEDFKTLRIKTPSIHPKLDNFRLFIVRWLKWHDSHRFWEEVNQRRQMFIPEQVFWDKDETGQDRSIAGYLDFPQTTHNGLCASIYRVALTRVLGVLPLDKFELYPLDRLTMTVLRDIHATEAYEPVADTLKTRLALGSVLVSGSTLEASISGPVIDIHFFVHYSSPLRGQKPALLFWLPKDNISDAPPRLARISKTASVAPEGWKSFEVPRFDNKGKSVGKRNPQETYQDWQNSSPVIVKAGHWSYEGNHDFLTVNIACAVEAAFLAKNELLQFLASRILPFIGLSKSHAYQNWHRLFEDQPCNNTNQANYGLLVYRSHPSSESVVRKLLDLLTQEGRKLALSRIFPVLPVRMRWSGSTFLIPPLVREDIRKALNSGNQARPILLFDDAAITGRTLNDLRVALSAIGVTKIKTLVIANRLRQPADWNDKEQFVYYWRLDLPPMGREGNCPLCHALHLAEAFSSSLSSSNAKKEIVGWKRLWGETSPLDNWSVGLRPLPLGTPEMGTKYCYRQNLEEAIPNEKKHLTIIDLIRSTGLVIHVTELHTMTGRDDYCLKKIGEHNEPEIRVELAASQLLLFGNEFDVNIRVELVKALIRELPRFKENSLHAPLAALAAISGLGLLEKESKDQAAKTVYEYDWLLRANYVTKVLLAYLASEMLINIDTPAYKIGKSLLSTASWSLSKRFNAWFLETLSPHGNAHSEAIPLLIDELTQSTDITELRIKDAIDSLDHLADIVDGLERILVRREELNTFREKTAAMKDTAKTAQYFLNKKLSDNISAGWHENTKQALEQYVTTMKCVADGYFHRIPSTKDYYKNRTFENIAVTKTIEHIDWKNAHAGKERDIKSDYVCDREIRFSRTGEISFDPNSGEVWIAWNRDIAGIVRGLLQNAVYANKRIRDPWDSGLDISADLWVRVNYSKKSVEMILVNNSTDDSGTIYEDLKKYRWSYLIELGGSVEPATVPQTGVVGIRVCIPYAAYLGS